MKPKTLDEAIKELVRLNIKPNQLSGVSIRNSWGLWSGFELAQWFYTRDIYHADDMSAIIIDSYKRVIKGEPLEINEQIQKYHKHWESCFGENHLSIMREETPFYKKSKSRDLKIETIINDNSKSKF